MRRARHERPRAHRAAADIKAQRQRQGALRIMQGEACRQAAARQAKVSSYEDRMVPAKRKRLLLHVAVIVAL